MIDESGVGALLDPIDRFAIQVGKFAELLLAQLPLTADGANSVSDLTSAGWYPSGQRIGWHAYTLVGAVIRVCTIAGTFPRIVFGRYTTPLTVKHTFE